MKESTPNAHNVATRFNVFPMAVDQTPSGTSTDITHIVMEIHRPVAQTILHHECVCDKIQGSNSQSVLPFRSSVSTNICFNEWTAEVIIRAKAHWIFCARV